MPEYKFTCDVCGKRFRRNVLKELKDEPAACPRCRTPFGRRELTPAERRRAARGSLLSWKFAGCG